MTLILCMANASIEACVQVNVANDTYTIDESGSVSN